jgi:hypothetical protein
MLLSARQQRAPSDIAVLPEIVRHPACLLVEIFRGKRHGHEVIGLCRISYKTLAASYSRSSQRWQRLHREVGNACGIHKTSEILQERSL